MTDIKNPTPWTDYDWLEFAGFAWKVENEGYEYASENYAPHFETPDLQAIVDDDDPRPLRTLYREHAGKVEAWQKAIGYEEVGRIWSAHLREEKERGEAHLLWAVHPGGDWNYAAYSDAFASREDAEEWIAGHAELVKKYGWKPWAGRLLHREQPGAEWVTVPREE